VKARAELRHRGQRVQPEAREQQRIARPAQRTEDHLDQARIVVHERLDHASVRIRIAAELPRGGVDRTLERDRLARPQHVRHRRGRVDPLQTMVLQLEALKKRRGRAERMHGRAAVVHESGQGQLGRTHAAAGLLFGFHHQHAQARAGERDRRGQPVGPAADHDRIVASLCSVQGHDEPFCRVSAPCR
jgi:hypothetical protein